MANKKWDELTPEEKQKRHDATRRWMKNNPERVKEIYKRAYERNYDSYKACHDKWVEEHYDHILEYQREYHRMYREKRKAELTIYRREWQQKKTARLKAEAEAAKEQDQ